MKSFTGPVAHRIEYLPPEQGVVGSNPTGLTIKKLPIPIIRNGSVCRKRQFQQKLKLSFPIFIVNFSAEVLKISQK